MMWRDDNVYDLLVVLGYNDFPRARNRGSAIFIHLVNSEKNPTAGCIALERRHMLRLLQWLKPASMVEIGR
jgi:L,D-peptidoglycan transpeptidase YkuD (ErfK/YbiS/YcfS/YnhG family)